MLEAKWPSDKALCIPSTEKKLREKQPNTGVATHSCVEGEDQL
jgi:hypothetical protein